MGPWRPHHERAAVNIKQALRRVTVLSHDPFRLHALDFNGLDFDVDLYAEYFFEALPARRDIGGSGLAMVVIEPRHYCLVGVADFMFRHHHTRMILQAIKTLIWDESPRNSLPY